jgi:hypothetical protein
MTIHFTDESFFECSTIEFSGSKLIADGVYEFEIEDVDFIQ